MPDKWECPRRPKQLVGAVMAAMAGFTNPRLSLDLWCGLFPALLFPLPLYLHGWDKKMWRDAVREPRMSLLEVANAYGRQKGG